MRHYVMAIDQGRAGAIGHGRATAHHAEPSGGQGQVSAAHRPVAGESGARDRRRAGPPASLIAAVKLLTDPVRCGAPAPAPGAPSGSG
jgi:hypothetical protein